MTPLARYQEDLKRPDFFHDAAQETAVRHLQRLYDDLVAAHKHKPGLLGSLFSKKTQDPVKGLYFWGGVGRGKTDLVSASGKACVCRTLEEVKAKFRPGMVLVVPSTTNEMLGYVRDAAALVVEEPGLNSHAAIVGNSLLKPTIVGAAGACSHIRDGLDIAVDCAHGSVQRLQA